jgi:hypothetical protein
LWYLLPHHIVKDDSGTLTREELTNLLTEMFRGRMQEGLVRRLASLNLQSVDANKSGTDGASLQQPAPPSSLLVLSLGDRELGSKRVPARQSASFLQHHISKILSFAVSTSSPAEEEKKKPIIRNAVWSRMA